MLSLIHVEGNDDVVIINNVWGAFLNLVIKGLQEKADKYETELQSSKAAETGK